MFNIFKRSKLSDGYNHELDNSKEGLNRLIQLTVQLEKEEDERDRCINLLNAIADNLGLNVWIKNGSGAFIYINEPAAKNIFKADVDTILHMKDSDFVNNKLAQICMITDKITIDKDKSCRFIEHSRYPSGDIWLDVVKNTLYIKSRFIGIQGVAKNITDVVPKEIRDEFVESGAVEIDLNLKYYLYTKGGKRKNDLKEILKRHKDSC